MFQFLNRRKQRERIRHEAEVALLTQQRDRALELVKAPRPETGLDDIRSALVAELERLDVYLDVGSEEASVLELVKSLAMIANHATEQVESLESMERAIVKQNNDQVRILQSLLAASEAKLADLSEWRYLVIRAIKPVHVTPDTTELLNVVQTGPSGLRDRKVKS